MWEFLGHINGVHVAGVVIAIFLFWVWLLMRAGSQVSRSEERRR